MLGPTKRKKSEVLPRTDRDVAEHGLPHNHAGTNGRDTSKEERTQSEKGVDRGNVAGEHSYSQYTDTQERTRVS